MGQVDSKEVKAGGSLVRMEKVKSGVQELHSLHVDP